MKKVGLLTSHASMNFGGLLQAYALQQTIKEFGFECQIINYKPQVHDLKKHPIQFVLQRKGFIKKGLFGVAHYGELKKKMSIIRKFREEYYGINEESVITKERLPAETDKYDILCVGSDQLWNLNQKDNEDKTYMLDFAHNCPSVSYAISFGDGLQKKRQEIEDALPLIRDFNYVSVRENEGKEFLDSHGISSALVLDPTLLVDTGFWDRFRNEERIIQEPYILVYGFENANQRYCDLIRAARRASEILNIKVVNPVMTPDLGNSGFENLYECGPEEFINLIDNASLVVTNSFHGSIFSSLFSTPFIAIVNRGSANDSRKGNLLKLLGLEKRAVGCDENWNMDEIMSFNFDSIDELLQAARLNSRIYLKHALEECGRLTSAK